MNNAMRSNGEKRRSWLTPSASPLKQHNLAGWRCVLHVVESPRALVYPKVYMPDGTLWDATMYHHGLRNCSALKAFFCKTMAALEPYARRPEDARRLLKGKEVYLCGTRGWHSACEALGWELAPGGDPLRKTRVSSLELRTHGVCLDVSNIVRGFQFGNLHQEFVIPALRTVCHFFQKEKKTALSLFIDYSTDRMARESKYRAEWEDFLDAQSEKSVHIGEKGTSVDEALLSFALRNGAYVVSRDGFYDVAQFNDLVNCAAHGDARLCLWFYDHDTLSIPAFKGCKLRLLF